MDPPDQKRINWQTQALPRTTRKALDFLSRAHWLKRTNWYLAGGTALALQGGHRSSFDLNFFTPEKDFLSGKLIAKFPKKAWVTEILREGTIYGDLFGAKVSFIAYPFFIPRQPFHWYGSIRILDRHDIAIMKVIAISQRGRKRDFVDLYWYCKNEKPLEDIIRCLPDQYPGVAHDFHHIIKSLAYFEDAEEDIMPKLFFKANWKSIKKFFQQEAKRIARIFVGL